MTAPLYPTAVLPRLEVSDLDIAYLRPDGSARPAVIGARLTLGAGESLGIVGESGSGKSTLARALLGYTRPGGRITGGQIRVDGRDIRSLPPEALLMLRGGRVAFVPQNPLSSLTPHIRVGPQVAEAVRIHRRCDAAAARAATLELFEATRLPDAQRLYRRFPHELSGGQRQRVVIAAALAGSPGLVVLDEPTTALDKTTEAQVLELVQSLRARTGASIVYVSHDLNVISEMCDRVIVMLDGRVIEEGPTGQVYRAPTHEYTRRLIASVPRLDRPLRVPTVAPVGVPEARTLLRVGGLHYRYPVRRLPFTRGEPTRPALDDLSFEIASGETLGLVGESGSGKSTAAALVAGLIAPDRGHLAFGGRALAGLAKDRRPDERRRIQMIFQDPLSSLNPRHRIGQILARPLMLFHAMDERAAMDEAGALLARMQLDPGLLECYPRQLSGGQQQRVAIARAFAARPDLIICDEITSALDVSVQAEVLDLLRDMQERSGVACLFISHDLGVIRQVAARVIVMQNGEVREAGDTGVIFDDPASEYTRLLIDAASRGYGNLPAAADS
jgi:peptide/nickel transport system ATP-binding protein